MSRPKYRFTPSLLQSWSDYVNSDRLWGKFYGSKESPSMTMQEFEAKKEMELWDAINRVDRGPIEAADRGTCLNEIVDMKVEWRREPMEGMTVRRLDNPDGRLRGIHAEMHGFVFEYSADLLRRLFEYFAGCTCQHRCEALLDTCYGPVILYGDADYIRRDKVYDLKSTMRYDYGKYEEGWQKDVYPYCLIESGEMEFVSEFEYLVVELDIPKCENALISGDIFRERYDYSHEGAKVRLREVCEQFCAYLDANYEKIEHPRIKNQ